MAKNAKSMKTRHPHIRNQQVAGSIPAGGSRISFQSKGLQGNYDGLAAGLALLTAKLTSKGFRIASIFAAASLRISSTKCAYRSTMLT